MNIEKRVPKFTLNVKEDPRNSPGTMKDGDENNTISAHEKMVVETNHPRSWGSERFLRIFQDGWNTKGIYHRAYLAAYL